MGMAQQFLHRAQFHAVLEHENSERVTQHMRGDCGDPGLPRVALDDEPEALACQPLSMMVDKERLLARMAQYQALPRCREIALRRLQRERREGQDTLVFPGAPLADQRCGFNIDI